ncbi:MAG: hypothetical protein ACLPUO_05065 [Streptosporangiaceae bacterium]|jgi:hypothetical protein
MSSETIWPARARASVPAPAAEVPAAGGFAGPGLIRRLQLVLAALWLLDAVLQFQSLMFTRSFTRMLNATGQHNPAVIAGPVSWSAHLIGQQAAAANAVFAGLQLVLGLGIAFRPTVRLALGASIAWALAVWWLGEGLGGLLTGAASPAAGAPGAALLYALLAVALWPSRGHSRGESHGAAPSEPRSGSDSDRRAPFAAAGRIGPAAARLLWLVLWGGLACLTLQPAARAPQALSSTISAMSAGQPAWLGNLDRQFSAALSHQGLAAAVILAALMAVIAAGIYLPPRGARIIVALAIAVAGSVWLAEGLGGILTGAGTDPSTGPLLALLAVAYWPLRTADAALAEPAGAS